MGPFLFVRLIPDFTTQCTVVFEAQLPEGSVLGIAAPVNIIQRFGGVPPGRNSAIWQKR